MLRLSLKSEVVIKEDAVVVPEIVKLSLIVVAPLTVKLPFLRTVNASLLEPLLVPFPTTNNLSPDEKLVALDGV